MRVQNPFTFSSVSHFVSDWLHIILLPEEMCSQWQDAYILSAGVFPLTHWSPRAFFRLERLFMSDSVGPGFEYCRLLTLLLLFGLQEEQKKETKEL